MDECSRSSAEFIEKEKSGMKADPGKSDRQMAGSMDMLSVLIIPRMIYKTFINTIIFVPTARKKGKKQTTNTGNQHRKPAPLLCSLLKFRSLYPEISILVASGSEF